MLFLLPLLSVAFVVGHPHQSHYKPDRDTDRHYNYYKVAETETVTLQLFYESMCPGCIEEYSQLPALVQRLGASLNLLTYPYGNARMHTENGHIVVECQHGVWECYGNKLHACAIDYLSNDASLYTKFIACLLQRESNDDAVDYCGFTQNIASEPIKTCAKGSRGEELLVYYGRESQKASYSGVPYALVNGAPITENEDLVTAVCNAFKYRPDACNHQ